MKPIYRVLVTILLFILGAGAGYFLADTVRGLVSPTGMKIISASPEDPFRYNLEFAVAFGLLFAVAGFLAQTLRWFAIYLGIGLGVSAASVGYSCLEYAYLKNLFATMQTGLAESMPLGSLPSFQIPAAGFCVIAGIAFVRWRMARNAATPPPLPIAHR